MHFSTKTHAACTALCTDEAHYRGWSHLNASTFSRVACFLLCCAVCCLTTCIAADTLLPRMNLLSHQAYIHVLSPNNELKKIAMCPY
jgi:hypothetical protein